MLKACTDNKKSSSEYLICFCISNWTTMQVDTQSFVCELFYAPKQASSLHMDGF